LKVWPAMRGDHLVGIGRLGLFDRLLPHVDADVRALPSDRWSRLVAVRHALGLGIGCPLLDERVVGRRS
jgi:hypothetical protein